MVVELPVNGFWSKVMEQERDEESDQVMETEPGAPEPPGWLEQAIL
jgi:hypothetical protein